MTPFISGIIGKLKKQQQFGLNPNAPQTGLNQQSGLLGGAYGMGPQPEPMSKLGQPYSMDTKAYDAGMFGSPYSINPGLLDQPKAAPQMNQIAGLLGGMGKQEQMPTIEAVRPQAMTIRQLLAMYRGQ